MSSTDGTRRAGGVFRDSAGDLQVQSTGVIAAPVDGSTAAAVTVAAFGVSVIDSTVTQTMTVATPQVSGIQKTVIVRSGGDTDVDAIVDFVLPIIGATSNVGSTGTLDGPHIITFDEVGSITCVSLSTAAWGLVSCFVNNSTEAGPVFSS